MEVARRNNGFRKVAKWIAGAIVVAGAATGGVDGGLLSIFKNAAREEDKLLHAPEAVGFVTSLGKKYTNKDIDDLVDRTGLKGTGGVTRHMLAVRRDELLREMNKFNSILEVLPEEIAVEAGKYATYDKLPAALAKEVKWNYFNKKHFGLMEQVPQDLADEMLKCDIYEGFSGKLIDKINAFLHPFDPSTVIIDESHRGKSAGSAPTTPGSTEVTEKSEKTKDAIKESDDSVKEGEESKEEEE
ncbi:Spherical Body Protein 2 truncated copy 3 (SBP2) [Babesia bovis T2Bo]|uniref:Spherical Body Protein 2 truncated copy 3 (SBP2) n=1 Tax=Babesia bovis TaxID=5865 RepID=A7ANK7_BABBO|nr:Spherical Body Protein 2 truncated copy 3 (SBP2) [Babesia bovis T2Bo]EDO08141.1 Spherical Body Protein 2 truncated copy 3 (SBP2) [Babesia bovis T2Bo]|eukprot:XP_001611709.1 Spherical Body Protein 2 truncated copy 3 (SBP2) [Babesia bovis T2Bo]